MIHVKVTNRVKQIPTKVTKGVQMMYNAEDPCAILTNSLKNKGNILFYEFLNILRKMPLKKSLTPYDYIRFFRKTDIS